MRNLLGQYTNKNTIVHKTDSRLKIIFIIIFSSFLIPVNEPIKLLFATFLVVVLLATSQISITYLIINIRAFVFLYIFILIMYIIFAREMLSNGVLSMWKFILLICLSLLLTATTTLSNLVKGIEWVFSPLKIAKINPKNIALMLSITIRFIPQFFLYSEKISSAQISRLSDFRKIKSIKAFIKKLISRMVASAGTLGDGIESRCYELDNSNITEFRSLRLTKIDYIAISLFCIIGVIYYIV